jgi:hypothetical protein
MSNLLVIVGCVLQVLGLLALFKVALAIKAYLRRDVVVRPSTVKARAQALPVRAVTGWSSLEAHVESIDESVWDLRQHVANIEWELETRWGKDIDETRQRLEEIFRTELDALRTATVGKREGLNVYRLLVASVLLVGTGVVLQTVAAVIA